MDSKKWLGEAVDEIGGRFDHTFCAMKWDIEDNTTNWEDVSVSHVLDGIIIKKDWNRREGERGEKRLWY